MSTNLLNCSFSKKQSFYFQQNKHSRFSWNKHYLFINRKGGWEIKTLNLFLRILRNFCGLYKETYKNSIQDRFVREYVNTSNPTKEMIGISRLFSTAISKEQISHTDQKSSASIVTDANEEPLEPTKSEHPIEVITTVDFSKLEQIDNDTIKEIVLQPQYETIILPKDERIIKQVVAAYANQQAKVAIHELEKLPLSLLLCKDFLSLLEKVDPRAKIETNPALLEALLEDAFGSSFSRIDLIEVLKIHPDSIQVKKDTLQKKLLSIALQKFNNLKGVEIQFSDPYTEPQSLFSKLILNLLEEQFPKISLSCNNESRLQAYAASEDDIDHIIRLYCKVFDLDVLNALSKIHEYKSISMQKFHEILRNVNKENRLAYYQSLNASDCILPEDLEESLEEDFNQVLKSQNFEGQLTAFIKKHQNSLYFKGAINKNMEAFISKFKEVSSDSLKYFYDSLSRKIISSCFTPKQIAYLIENYKMGDKFSLKSIDEYCKNKYNSHENPLDRFKQCIELAKLEQMPPGFETTLQRLIDGDSKTIISEYETHKIHLNHFSRFPNSQEYKQLINEENLIEIIETEFASEQHEILRALPLSMTAFILQRVQLPLQLQIVFHYAKTMLETTPKDILDKVVDWQIATQDKNLKLLRLIYWIETHEGEFDIKAYRSASAFVTKKLLNKFLFNNVKVPEDKLVKFYEIYTCHKDFSKEKEDELGIHEALYTQIKGLGYSNYENLPAVFAKNPFIWKDLVNHYKKNPSSQIAYSIHNVFGGFMRLIERNCFWKSALIKGCAEHNDTKLFFDLVEKYPSDDLIVNANVIPSPFYEKLSKEISQKPIIYEKTVKNLLSCMRFQCGELSFEEAKKSLTPHWLFFTIVRMPPEKQVDIIKNIYGYNQLNGYVEFINTFHEKVWQSCIKFFIEEKDYENFETLVLNTKEPNFSHFFKFYKEMTDDFIGNLKHSKSKTLAQGMLLLKNAFNLGDLIDWYGNLEKGDFKKGVFYHFMALLPEKHCIDVIYQLLNKDNKDEAVIHTLKGLEIRLELIKKCSKEKNVEVFDMLAHHFPKQTVQSFDDLTKDFLTAYSTQKLPYSPSHNWPLIKKKAVIKSVSFRKGIIKSAYDEGQLDYSQSYFGTMSTQKLVQEAKQADKWPRFKVFYPEVFKYISEHYTFLHLIFKKVNASEEAQNRLVDQENQIALSAFGKDSLKEIFKNFWIGIQENCTSNQPLKKDWATLESFKFETLPNSVKELAVEAFEECKEISNEGKALCQTFIDIYRYKHSIVKMC